MSEKTSFLLTKRFYVAFLLAATLVLAISIFHSVRSVFAAEPTPGATANCEYSLRDITEAAKKTEYMSYCVHAYDFGGTGVCEGAAVGDNRVPLQDNLPGNVSSSCGLGILAARDEEGRCQADWTKLRTDAADATNPTYTKFMKDCKNDRNNTSVPTQGQANNSESSNDTTSTINTAKAACEKGLTLAPEGSNWDPVEFKQYCEAGFSNPGQGICKDVVGTLDSTGSKLDVVKNNTDQPSDLSNNLKVTACGIGASYSGLQGKSCDDQWAAKGQKPEGSEYDAFIKKCREGTATAATTPAGENKSCNFIDEDGTKQSGVLRPNSLVCVAEGVLGNTKPSVTTQGKTDPNKGMGDDLDSYIDNSGGKQSIKVTKTKVKGDAPAIVMVHGGGWYSDGGTWNEKIRQRFAKAGFTTFRIQYRLIPAGVIEQREDVMRAIRHISNNADRYGIDKKRLSIMGDSAGGSLATRVASTGRSPAKAVVGWSAPTNAFRDLFNSADGWAAGLWHSRCLGEYVPSQFVDAANFAQNNSGSLGKLAQGKGLSPAESGALLNDSLSLGKLAIDDLPDTAGKLKKGMNDFGFSLKGTKSDEAKAAGATDSSTSTSTTDKRTTSTTTDGTSTTDTANTTPDPALVDKTNEKLKNLTPEQSEKIGEAITIFNQSTSDTTDMSEDDIEALSIAKKGLSQLNIAMGTLIDEETDAQKAEKEKTGDTSKTDTTKEDGTSTDGQNSLTAVQEAAKKNMDIELMDVNALGNEATLSFNPMSISTTKIAQCIDDFIQLSPALVASPRTPAGLFISAEKERWVNQADTYQMRDKLRSMGVKSDARVLPFSKKNLKSAWPGDGHMGYDERAEKYSIEWLTKHFKVKSEAQQAEEGAAAKKAEEDKKAAEAAQSSSSNQKTADNGFVAPNTQPNVQVGSNLKSVDDCNAAFGAYNWHWVDGAGNAQGCAAGAGEKEKQNCRNAGGTPVDNGCRFSQPCRGTAVDCGNAGEQSDEYKATVCRNYGYDSYENNKCVRVEVVLKNNPTKCYTYRASNTGDRYDFEDIENDRDTSNDNQCRYKQKVTRDYPG